MTVLLRTTPPFLLAAARQWTECLLANRPFLFILVELRTNDRPDRPNRLLANWRAVWTVRTAIIRVCGKVRIRCEGRGL